MVGKFGLNQAGKAKGHEWCSRFQFKCVSNFLSGQQSLTQSLVSAWLPSFYFRDLEQSENILGCHLRRCGMLESGTRMDVFHKRFSNLSHRKHVSFQRFDSNPNISLSHSPFTDKKNR